MKILFFYGTRPELIKLGLLMSRCAKQHEVYKVCTKQHSSLFNGISDLFEPPDECFSVPEHRNISDLTQILIGESDKVIKKIKPDIVIVQGDTCTAFSCCLSAFYNNIQIGHVEAGLRTYNNKSPYPEEFYRKSISSMADYHWCPTDESKNNLITEKVNGELIVTGNTIVDTLDYFLRYNEDGLDNCNNSIIVTLHRRENKDDFFNILEQIARISENNNNLKFMLLSHPNPIIKDVIERMDNSSIKVLPPAPYLEFINLLFKCRGVITDSGGVQEECVTLRKKALICRKYTERKEGIKLDICRLVGNDVLKNISWLMEPITKIYKNPYGNGNACSLIINSLERKRI